MSIQRFLRSFTSKEELASIEKEAARKQIKSIYGDITNSEVNDILQLGTVAFSSLGVRKIRFIGLNEIVNAEQYLHVPFPALHLLPLFDIMDNDFICYHMQENRYYVFNIIDESMFNPADTMEEVLDKL